MLWLDSSNGAPSPSHETTPPNAVITKSNDSLGTCKKKIERSLKVKQLLNSFLGKKKTSTLFTSRLKKNVMSLKRVLHALVSSSSSFSLAAFSTYLVKAYKSAQNFKKLMSLMISSNN